MLHVRFLAPVPVTLKATVEYSDEQGRGFVGELPPLQLGFADAFNVLPAPPASDLEGMLGHAAMPDTSAGSLARRFRSKLFPLLWADIASRTVQHLPTDPSDDSKPGDAAEASDVDGDAAGGAAGDDKLQTADGSEEPQPAVRPTLRGVETVCRGWRLGAWGWGLAE